MAEQAENPTAVHELSPEPVLQIRDELSQSAALLTRWLNVLEDGSSDDALISADNLAEVLRGQVRSFTRYAESLPDRQVSEILDLALRARCAENEATLRMLAELPTPRWDPRWRKILVEWVKAAQTWSQSVATLAADVAKRLRGPQVRRAQADENNATLINAIIFYRTDPRTGEPRSARKIAAMLRRGDGFAAFTQRRSEEALVRLVQRILRKAENPETAET